MRRIVPALALLLVQFGGGSGPAVATGLCVKPGVPVCMSDRMTFLSADRMSACQAEVKDYVDQTIAYLNCLNAENVATGQEMTRNVERFNCYLSGGKDCG